MTINENDSLPGTETIDAEDTTHPTAQEPEYHEAGGTRRKGEEKPRETGGDAGDDAAVSAAKPGDQQGGS